MSGCRGCFFPDIDGIGLCRGVGDGRCEAETGGAVIIQSAFLGCTDGIPVDIRTGGAVGEREIRGGAVGKGDPVGVDQSIGRDLHDGVDAASGITLGTDGCSFRPCSVEVKKEQSAIGGKVFVILRSGGRTFGESADGVGDQTLSGNDRNGVGPFSAGAAVAVSPLEGRGRG